MRRHAHPTNAGPVRTAAVRAKWLRLAAAAIVAGAGIHAADGSADQLYLRAGMGLDRPAETAFTDLDCSSASPAALYGCGRGGDGAPYRSVGDFGTAPVLELGLGYAAAPAVRLEVLAEYRPRLAFDGRANFLATARRQSVVAKLSSLSAILAAYVDLPGLGLPRLGPLAPFVGAGVGAARTWIGETRMTFPATTTIVPGASRTGFAWMLTAGVAVALDERMTLDLAWRYSDLGEVRTRIERARLVAVHDPVGAAAEEVAGAAGARRASCEEIMAAPDIDAVVIATPTDLHTACIEAAARSGKAIFCEKPIGLDLDRARACIEIVRETGARLMVGFNRRFDPDFAEVRRHVETGAIGDVELVQITSRDPAPPPIDYVTRSGGLFLDMMIHDFDMVRFLLREEVVEVSATGSVLIDERTGVAGDFDTAAATLNTASGRIALISNSRRAAYGYDQRLEVHGSKGMVSAGNRRNTTDTVAGAGGYRSELEAFVDALASGDRMAPDGYDGLKALEIAVAARRSAREHRVMRLSE